MSRNPEGAVGLECRATTRTCDTKAAVRSLDFQGFPEFSSAEGDVAPQWLEGEGSVCRSFTGMMLFLLCDGGEGRGF